MGKAFTDNERIQIQNRLRKAGLMLFAKKGVKGVSIRELTSAANISQGGFYTFYKDKDEFMIDLMELRIKQKLANYEKERESSFKDPIKYLSDILYKEGMHLKDHKAFMGGVSSSIRFIYDEQNNINERLSIHYKQFLQRLADYWTVNGYTVHINIDGLMSVIRTAAIIFSNANLIEEEYFAIIYRSFCDSCLLQFLEVCNE